MSDETDRFGGEAVENGGAEPMECRCGTVIPPEGLDWEPRCRFCERLHISRGFEHATEELE